MVDQQRLTPLREGPPLVASCWMCGIRLSADHMMPDGGSACDDVRWYCRDTRACTERWTARSVRPGDVRHDAEVRQGAGGNPGSTRQASLTGPGAAWPSAGGRTEANR
jgi:hypothetical protein